MSHYYNHPYNSNPIVYPQLPDPLPDRDHQQKPPDPPKPESKPQATFLTKLYASVAHSSLSPLLILSYYSLLERPENHHMIRWDAAGDHIIVEKPEQLALHVLPSIYRQSRFASFSRQLNVRDFCLWSSLSLSQIGLYRSTDLCAK